MYISLSYLQGKSSHSFCRGAEFNCTHLHPQTHTHAHTRGEGADTETVRERQRHRIYNVGRHIGQSNGVLNSSADITSSQMPLVHVKKTKTKQHEYH